MNDSYEKQMLKHAYKRAFYLWHLLLKWMATDKAQIDDEYMVMSTPTDEGYLDMSAAPGLKHNNGKRTYLR